MSRVKWPYAYWRVVCVFSGRGGGGFQFFFLEGGNGGSIFVKKFGGSSKCFCIQNLHSFLQISLKTISACGGPKCFGGGGTLPSEKKSPNFIGGHQIEWSLPIFPEQVCICGGLKIYKNHLGGGGGKLFVICKKLKNFFCETGTK